MKISIINTKTVPTVQVELDNKIIIFHSKYDPIHATNKWVENACSLLKPNEEIIIIGLCAGYHIITLAQTFPNSRITVIEFNDIYYNWFVQSPFVDNCKKCTNVIIKQFSELKEEQKKELFSSINSWNILISNQYLQIIPTTYRTLITILENIELQNNSLAQQIGFMQDNFKRNIALNDQGINNLHNVYMDRPMILISAGPSLTKQLPLLKKIKENKKFVIGAVGTALSPLISNGITPDFFTIIDAQTPSQQLENINLPKTLLYYLSTASTDTVLLHNGPRRIIWQEGYEEAEKMARKNMDPAIQTGGSVATALLDIMVYLGGQKIALVGQDLAFTEGKTHAEGTHSLKKIEEKTNVSSVANYYQTAFVRTSKNLNLYRTWFETYAQNHPELSLFNCTEGGAYINNWRHISLFDYYHLNK